MNFTTIYIEETDSTNHWLRQRLAIHAEETQDNMLVWADHQTAGRGQGSNSWESERGRNLTFSVLWRPKDVPVAAQFVLSMAHALALKAALDTYLEGVKIKWPNDIYWQNRKLCGTLIETTVRGGRIKDCIIGTGVNVNQRHFTSDAPNPVSLCQILDRELDREEVLRHIVTQTVKYLEWVDAGRWDDVRSAYRHALYRRSERHLYRMDGEERPCRLVDVTDDGHLLLLSDDGQLRHFAFKEVQFVV